MFGQRNQPVLVLSQNTKRESGRKVQRGNIQAGKTIADVIRTCLGPRAMLKMLMDPMGGIVMTNDGNAILREITVQHPSGKMIIEIARTQDEEVGDGTTSVVVLAGEMLAVAEPFLEQQLHPTVIIRGFRQALEDMVDLLKNEVSMKLDLSDEKRVVEVLKSCIGTKIISQWADLACSIALQAVKAVTVQEKGGRVEVDIKRYAKVEKVAGGSIEDSYVLRGIMLNKDVTHPKMRRRIENPRILLLDCNLEYKKGESMTNIEISAEHDFTRYLEIEEEYIQKLCSDIIAFKPDLVFTEKGVSDLAQHFLAKANISVLRRVKKTDNNRIARAVGATICHRTDEIKDEDIGTQCGLFEVKKIGDEYFTYLSDCKDPKACTIVLRGASKDILKEVERNLNDAMCVARNLALYPAVVAGGGSVEMAVAKGLSARAKNVEGVEQGPYRAVATALEVIPRTLIQNCGGNTIKGMTALRAKCRSMEGSGDANCFWGINGETGEIEDMSKLGIWDPVSVKLQVYKTAVETAILLLRIDDIVSGTKKADGSDTPAGGGRAEAAGPPQEME
ncbi:unnamed protein product [Cyprideis torosa]|uniref:T-complex protein 1 subunit gamma n=1 Tax=Cyprideis torosa TaxID=163714 RepID=A0A7R8W2H4_9CRUS|nr:unnamed protein product [Cyprideis torosa]CAG0881885.1 unnamed protein product [Cyprideis torosa]